MAQVAPMVAPSVGLSNRPTGKRNKPSDQPEKSLVLQGESLLREADGAETVGLFEVEEVGLFTTEEAASLAGVSQQAIQKAIADKRLAAEPYEITEGRHKGRKAYRIAPEALFALYPHARRAWELRQAQAQAAAAPAEPLAAPAEAEAPLALKDWQRRVMDARAAILRHLEDRRAALEAGHAAEHVLRKGQKGRAIVQLVVDAERGQLPEAIQGLIPLANARGGKAGGRTLSIRTLERWLDAAKDGVDHLAPKAG